MAERYEGYGTLKESCSLNNWGELELVYQI